MLRFANTYDFFNTVYDANLCPIRTRKSSLLSRDFAFENRSDDIEHRDSDEKPITRIPVRLGLIEKNGLTRMPHHHKEQCERISKFRHWFKARVFQFLHRGLIGMKTGIVKADMNQPWQIFAVDGKPRHALVVDAQRESLAEELHHKAADCERRMHQIVT
jgi:hypothetical protein